MHTKNLQYGCGLSAPKDWINYDASPMIILQKIPIVGKKIQKIRKVKFPDNVKYGNIVKGFPKYINSCNAIFCSHVLEHLSYEEFKIAIRNSFQLLKDNGIFRIVIPDLERLCKNYLLDENNPDRSINFMKNSGLGVEKRRKFIDKVKGVFGNSQHLWLWDYKSIEKKLKETGFKNIRLCEYNDSEIKDFESVENIDRFKGSIAIEAKK